MKKYKSEAARTLAQRPANKPAKRPSKSFKGGSNRHNGGSRGQSGHPPRRR